MSNWVPAQSAWFVINSEKRGGMGQLEAIPFRQKQAANNFIQQYKGNLVSYADIPKDYILGNTK